MLKMILVAGALAAGTFAAAARDGATLEEAGLMPVEVVGFQSAIPAGLPMFAALPRMAPGAELDLRSIDTSGLVAFAPTMPGFDPNADIATGSVRPMK
ncbi:hypothetical protein [uncultured Methylobacterium sp.]|jgi:hypothetical protein|uniref:hypothetical protein n=1 Tax=uncultured Methylobacterium sp. TaxID=157278 RepID=UPI0026364751|nr:hypothetical protein [uncultured Methylobacterium sp.]